MKTLILGKTYNEVEVESLEEEDINLREAFEIVGYINRWGGKLKRNWSVLDHSLVCYRLAEKNSANREVKLASLVHDLDEAYTGDVITPIKKLLTGEGVDAIEHLHHLIFEIVELDHTDTRYKVYDKDALELEKFYFLGGRGTTISMKSLAVMEDYLDNDYKKGVEEKVILALGLLSKINSEA